MRNMTVHLCVPIAVCMSRDFNFTNEEIGKTFSCTGSTIKKKFENFGYKPISQSAAAEQRLRKAWDDYGYSEKFDLIGEYQGRYQPIKYRCKICGAVSVKQASTISVSHSNLRCSNCWIHRDDKTAAPRDGRLLEHVADDYRNGMTTAAIQDKYNLQQQVVTRFLREAGVRTNPNRDCYFEQVRKENELKRKAKENNKRIVSGFKEIENDVTEWRRQLSSVCEIQSAKRTKQRLSIIAREIESMHDYEPQIAICKHCGKQWLFWPSRERYAHKKPPVFCSTKCNYKHYKTGTISDRLRRYGRANEYRECITLDEVIEKDNGICYLCGCKTSKADSWLDANGYFVCGDTYPTRDHVIPISKGGTHTRDNVRLACRKCNSRKSNTCIEEYAADLG